VRRSNGAHGFVAVLVIHLHFPDAGSLKSKRRELSSVKAQLHGRLGAAVAEVEHQDLWQRATLTAALTSGSLARLTEAADTVDRWLQARCPECVRIERVVLSLGDLQELVGWGSAVPPTSGAEG
jgi:uncharacterized protein